MRTFILFILSLLSINYSQAGTCTNYFSGNNIYSIAEGKQAYWFATECKIARLDKITGTITYSVHQPQTNCFDYYYYNLYVDTSENLWMGGRDGLYKFDGSIWTTIDTNSTKLLGIDKNNNVWFDYDSLIKYDGTTFTSYPTPFESNTLTFDSHGNLWACGYGGIFKFSTAVDTIFNTFNTPMPGDMLTAINVDSLDNIWFTGQWTYDTISGSQKTFVGKYDGTNWTMYNDTNSGLPDYSGFREIDIDQNQNIWFTGINGLVKYTGSTWSTEYIPSTQLGDYSNLLSLIIDENDDKWLGTLGTGVLKSDSTNWQKINLSNSGLPGNFVVAVEKDKYGVLWVGTENHAPNYWNNYGLVEYDSTGWTNHSSDTLLIPFKAEAMLNDHNDNLWVTNERFLHKYDGTSWQKFPVDLLGSTISMTVDNQNHIWLGSTSRALKKFDGINWTTYSSLDYGCPFNHYLKSVDVDINNNIWIGTMLTVAKYDHVNWYPLSCVDSSGNSCWGYINAIKTDLLNNLWIASWTPLSLTKYDGINYYRYKTKNNGLDDEELVCMAVDSLNRMYFGTSYDGLIVFDGINWIRYNTSNSGILNNEILTIKITHNEIWIGSLAGLTKFDFCGGDTITVASNLIITGTENINSVKSSLHVYPTPFTDYVHLEYNLGQSSNIELQIFDINSRLIKHIKNLQSNPSGELEIKMDPTLPHGIYPGVLKSGSEIIHFKLVK